MMRTIFGGRGWTALYRDTREGKKIQGREAQAQAQQRQYIGRHQWEKRPLLGQAGEGGGEGGAGAAACGTCGSGPDFRPDRCRI